MTVNLRTILVDDEEPARVRMRSLLAESTGIEIVAECGSGDDALEWIQREQPDLVFLDIEMPGLSGIEVISRLRPPRPQVVFCTAYDQYAVQAFEEHAVDYLLKPVARPRLERALNRVREALAGRGSYRNEREEAREAQSRLYPGRLPGMATLDFGGICRPALGVGGDYYDFLPLGPGRLGIAVGDVCGKGMPAALLMAAVQGRLQASAAHFEDDLAGLFRDLNHHLCAATGGARFVTLCYGVYDEADRSFRYVNAGHNPPLLWPGEAEADGGPILLEAGGVVLGLLEEAEYSVGSVPLQANDTLVLFTDGVTEATNRAEAEFGLDRLVALVERERRGDAAGLLGAIEATVEAFLQGAPLHDDFTLVVAKGK